MESSGSSSLKRPFSGVEVHEKGHLTKKPYVAAGEVASGGTLEEAGGRAPLMSVLHEISEELKFAIKCLERSAGEETSTFYLHFIFIPLCKKY